MSLTSIRLREAWNWGGLTVKQVALRTYEAMDKHETIDRAAIVAFYAILSLVPFLGLILTTTLGSAGGVVAGEILGLSRQLLPEAADRVVRDEVDNSREGPRVGVLSVSFLILLWSASSAFVSIMDSTNAAHGVRDG